MQNVIKIYDVVEESRAFLLTCNGRTYAQIDRRALTVIIQEVFHVYLNKFENAVTYLFLVILGNS